MEKAIYNILVNDSTVSGITTNIYPFVLPQNASLPAVTYQRIMTGMVEASGTTPALRSTELQITAYTQDGATSAYAQAVVLGEAVRDALDRKSGTFNGVVVDQIFFDNERDTYEFTSDKHGRVLEFVCWYEG